MYVPHHCFWSFLESCDPSWKAGAIEGTSFYSLFFILTTCSTPLSFLSGKERECKLWRAHLATVSWPLHLCLLTMSALNRASMLEVVGKGEGVVVGGESVRTFFLTDLLPCALGDNKISGHLPLASTPGLPLPLGGHDRHYISEQERKACRQA